MATLKVVENTETPEVVEEEKVTLDDIDCALFDIKMMCYINNDIIEKLFDNPKLHQEIIGKPDCYHVVKMDIEAATWSAYQIEKLTKKAEALVEKMHEQK